jgi:haloalkane dehalogenase
MMQRPDWFDEDLFPFESHTVEIDGSVVHYIDEGEGVPLLMLHGNPTWSFLYRKLIGGLSGTFRCIALDYPGFGLSTAPAGYTYTAAEHSAVVEGFIDQLGLDGIVLVVQDWGGPIGMGVATRRPERFQAFVIGNTWAWPFGDDPRISRFSAAMGGDRSGELLSQRLNVFVNVFLKRGMRRRKPTEDEMGMWRGPFPTVESRLPVRVFPREIVSAAPFLEEIENGLENIADRPALLFHADKDMAFGRRELRRWESIFPDHRTYVLEGAGHYWQDDAGNEAVLAIRDWWSSLPG